MSVFQLRRLNYMQEGEVRKEKSKLIATVLHTAAIAVVFVLMNASVRAQTIGAPTLSVNATILMTNVLQVNLGNGLYPTAKAKCDTQNNPQCCGGSTNICSTNGMATVTCASGVCNGTCAAGRGDCNGNKLTDGCETVLNTVDHCGGCGTVCSGFGQSTGDASCIDAATGQCGFTCRGENYDVDNNAADGCERPDANPPGHNQAAASSLGSKDNNDTNASFNQVIISDGRVHTNPAIDGFNNTTGAAPDWWSVNATGGTFGINDYVVTFTTNGGSGAAPCYTITIITNSKTQSCTTSGSGSCSINSGSGAYTGGTTVYFKVEKTCSSATREAATYSVQYHL
jgi:hypothetical protein